MIFLGKYNLYPGLSQPEGAFPVKGRKITNLSQDNPHTLNYLFFLLAESKTNPYSTELVPSYDERIPRYYGYCKEKWIRATCNAGTSMPWSRAYGIT